MATKKARQAEKKKRVLRNEGHKETTPPGKIMAGLETKNEKGEGKR